MAPVSARIFHIATVADWTAAQASGRYTTSTRGRTLAEEGFIHASRADQWQGVRERYYADVEEPLVLLVIDPERLSAPVVVEEVPGSGETFPHVYGVIEPGAVEQAIPLNDAGGDAPLPAEPREPSASFSRLFLTEVMRNVVTAVVVLVAVTVGLVAGALVDERWGPLAGAAVGLVVGTVLARRLRHAEAPARVRT